MLVLIPCAVIRFILFAPAGYYRAYGSTHWDVIKDHVVLHNGFYNPAIAVGEKFASHWGTFAFFWNIVWIFRCARAASRTPYLTRVRLPGFHHSGSLHRSTSHSPSWIQSRQSTSLVRLTTRRAMPLTPKDHVALQLMTGIGQLGQMRASLRLPPD
jgi:hypothetical protein